MVIIYIIMNVEQSALSKLLKTQLIINVQAVIIHVISVMVLCLIIVLNVIGKLNILVMVIVTIVIHHVKDV